MFFWICMSILQFSYTIHVWSGNIHIPYSSDDSINILQICEIETHKSFPFLQYLVRWVG